MANIPLNLFPPNTQLGFVDLGNGKRLPVFIDLKWHDLLFQMIRRMGGPANYTISDLASLTFTDGAILVGNGTGLVLESGATARASLGLTIGADVQEFDQGLKDIADLADPGADRILFWDDSAGAYKYLTAGTGLTITDTTIASGGGGGSLVLLEQHTASTSASLDFTTCITSTYDEYVVELINVTPVTDGANLLLRMSTDGGSNYDSGSNYSTAARFAGSANDTNFHSSSASATAMQIFGNPKNTTSLGGVSGSMKMYSPGSTSVHTTCRSETNYPSGTNYYHLRGAGTYKSLTAVDAFQFLFSTGNIASGTIRVYGIAK